MLGVVFQTLELHGTVAYISFAMHPRPSLLDVVVGEERSSCICCCTDDAVAAAISLNGAIPAFANKTLADTLYSAAGVK